MISHVDVLIVGGGPIGASLALAIGKSGHRVLLAEARTTQPTDARTLAISHGTMVILRRLGVSLASLNASPIENIHVSQKGGFGRTILRANESKLPALGYVVSYAALSKHLETALLDNSVSVIFGAHVATVKSTAGYGVAHVLIEGQPKEITARLIVFADGGHNAAHISGIEIIEREYNQSAIVAMVKTQTAASTTAYERFTATGPLALLPYHDEYALIWTASTAEAVALHRLETATFLNRLQMHASIQPLQFINAGLRTIFPLRLRYAKPVISQRIALVGNAAQALHPVAGQGFNLGMRDIEALATCIHESSTASLGDSSMLSRYRLLRGWDVGGGIAATDLLVRGFSNTNPFLQTGRGIGLAALDILPTARKWLSRKMMFGISG